MTSTASAPALGGAPPVVPSKDSDEPQVDFVLVFEARDPKLIKAKKQASSTDIQSRLTEYNKILTAIRGVGLQVTARASSRNESQLLIFVRAPDQTLVASGKLESLHDYLHGVKSNFEPAATSSLTRSSSLSKDAIKSQAQTFTSAERVRYIYDLLTRPSPHGAGLGIGTKQYPHLKDMTPIHDPNFNHDWLKRWSNASSMLQIKVTELDNIRTHFGEHIAYYFGFLNFYFQSLFTISAIGVAFWWAGWPFHPVYSLLLVGWAGTFVELWRMKERKLAVRWGTVGVSHVDARRNEFRPRIVRKDQATGEDEEVFEWWRRELRIAFSIPVMLFFAGLLAATLTTMFATEVFVSKLYGGPGKQVVPFVPTALFSICVPQIMAAWQSTAAALTSWENHYSVRTHNAAMTLKMFALQAFVAYGALTLSAFIYIPFGQSIMDHIVKRGFFSASIKDAVARGDLTRNSNGGIAFDIKPNRMHAQLFAVLTTSQVINALTEVAVPYITRKISEYSAAKGEKGKSNGTRTNDASSPDAKLLHRIEEELALPNYDTFGDYAEMATQFGYIVLWSVIWPLAPVMGFVNNFFELRSDALKMTINARRPVPIRADSIGPWLEVLGFLAWLAAMLNASLVYLFQPSPESHLPGHSPYETVLRTHLHPAAAAAAEGTTPGKLVDSIVYPSDPAHSPRSPLSFSNLLPSSLPTSGTAGALLASLLLALASEHIYGIVRASVRHVLERALWRGSIEETTLRQREWQSRRDAIDRSGLAPQATAALKAAAPSSVGQAEQHGFWLDAESEGRALIEASSKSE